MNTMNKWKIMIVFHDEEVHKLIKRVAEKVDHFDGPVQVMSAYSAKSAQEILDIDQEYAGIFINPCLEKGESGIELVKYIRNTLNNHDIRIILLLTYQSQYPKSQLKELEIYDCADFVKLQSEDYLNYIYDAVKKAINMYHVNNIKKDLQKNGIEV